MPNINYKISNYFHQFEVFLKPKCKYQVQEIEFELFKTHLHHSVIKPSYAKHYQNHPYL
jgi:hypothetical protein